MSEILQGTLDLMVLKTLDAMGALHGYGIARRIEQVSGDVLQLNQGTIYASLLRLQQKLIDAEAPFEAPNGTAAAFVTTPEDPDIVAPLIEYVRVFVPEHTGTHFSPHVTIGLGTKEFLDAMLAEPFASFTFSPVGASVYHLGNYGTAMRSSMRSR